MISDNIKRTAHSTLVFPCHYFVIYINDLDENILSKILKFATDTKLARGIKTLEDYYELLEDLSNLYKWSEDWQMSFN